MSTPTATMQVNSLIFSVSREPALLATANAATVDLGPSPPIDPAIDTFPAGFSAPDTYTLDITAGSGATPVVSVTLNGGSYDFTLDGMVSAFQDAGANETIPGKSGLLPNGVSYDISNGSLVLTGPVDGSEIELNESAPGLLPPSAARLFMGPSMSQRIPQQM